MDIGRWVSLVLHLSLNDAHYCLDSNQVGYLNCQRIQYLMFASSTPGESPPPPPRVLFGRNELVEKIVYRAESLFPFALIGAGGIGKTSIALTVLHDDRIKQRFGDNRRFIRCDQFPASLAHFIGQISKATGAGVKNPKDMASLLRFLPSEEIFVVLDSAESILDPRGANVQEIYAAVEELSRFSNICLCITSRTPTIPPACESLDIPILSMEAARAAFYHIYKNGGQSNTVNSILEQLNFHALSITLLATVAHHNEWGTNQLGREWERQRMGSLRTLHSNSLAATIGFSLASPTFQELGPDARELLGITAFFPQGVNENNLDRFFPTTPDRRNIFDRFCVLSLTYRNDGFITMLAPLRDYFSPKDPTSSSLLRTIKEYYFSQLSIRVNPGDPDFEGVRWVASEGVNIEHLLSVFASTDVGSDDVWDACANFMRHLYRHKPWLAVLESKIEGLPDHHPSKPHCFFRLSQLFGQIWNGEERMRLLIHTLRLWGERGDDFEVAQALMRLADASWFHVHGIRQAKKALEIFERLGRRTEQAQCLQCLARLLKWDKAQRDAAEEAASRSLDLLLDKDEEFLVCEYYYTLGGICNSKDEIGKANNHFKTALGIASSFGWQDRQFWIHHSLATMFFHKQRFDDAQAHAERAKVYAVNDARLLGCAMNLRAIVLYSQRRYEEAKSEALRAADVHEKLGDTGGLDASEEYLDLIERATSNLAYINSELLEMVPLLTPINS